MLNYREQLDTIEDVIPIYDIKLSIKVCKRKVLGVVCVPQQQKLSFVCEDGRVKFCLPKLEGYQVISISFIASK